MGTDRTQKGRQIPGEGSGSWPGWLGQGGMSPRQEFEFGTLSVSVLCQNSMSSYRQIFG